MLWSLVLYVFYIFVIVKLFVILTCGRCTSKVCLIGKTALITGGNSGIGFQAALALASRGCRVILTDITDPNKTKHAIVQATDNTNIVVKRADFQSFKSVRALAKDILETENRLDILINNAGIGTKGMVITEDNLSRTLQVNYFSHFLLTHLLLGLLKKTAPSRIIFTSSSAAFLVDDIKVSDLSSTACKENDRQWSVGAYGESKVLQAMAAVIFGDKLRGTGVTSNAFHPGGVNSNIFQKAFKEERNYFIKLLSLFAILFGKTPEEGAQTMIHLACEKSLQSVSGEFFIDCVKFFKPKLARNRKLCRDIFHETEKIVQIPENERI